MTYLTSGLSYKCNDPPGYLLAFVCFCYLPLSRSFFTVVVTCWDGWERFSRCSGELWEGFTSFGAFKFKRSTSVNILSKRARMRFLPALLAPEYWFWSSGTFGSGPGVSRLVLCAWLLSLILVKVLTSVNISSRRPLMVVPSIPLSPECHFQLGSIFVLRPQDSEWIPRIESKFLKNLVGLGWCMVHPICSPWHCAAWTVWRWPHLRYLGLYFQPCSSSSLNVPPLLRPNWGDFTHLLLGSSPNR